MIYRVSKKQVHQNVLSYLINIYDLTRVIFDSMTCDGVIIDHVIDMI
jgi:hypothetical protein